MRERSQWIVIHVVYLLNCRLNLHWIGHSRLNLHNRWKLKQFLDGEVSASMNAWQITVTEKIYRGILAKFGRNHFLVRFWSIPESYGKVKCAKEQIKKEERHIKRNNQMVYPSYAQVEQVREQYSRDWSRRQFLQHGLVVRWTESLRESDIICLLNHEFNVYSSFV